MATIETPLTNGTAETLPTINHTVFPTASISVEAPTTVEPNPAPTPTFSVEPPTTNSEKALSVTPISIEPPTTIDQQTIQTPTISVDSPTTTDKKTMPILSKPTDDEPLFSSDLISPAIAAQLPPTYTIRAMKKSDYHIGFLDCLRVLTVVGDITEEEFNQRYEFLTTQGKGGYYMLVIEDGGRIVGTGALIVERKFIHHLGLVGHIEDIAVAKDQQGKKLGLKLIQALDFIAEKVGCYKTILDCSEANEGFYVKCGFKRAGLEMAHYYEQPKST